MPRLLSGKVLACSALLGAWAATSQTVGATCVQGSCPSGSDDDVALLQRAKRAGAEIKEHTGDEQQDAQGLPGWGPVEASTVCLWNQGAYALEYKIRDEKTGWVIAQTSAYPNPQTRCTVLGAQAGVENGEEFSIWATAVAGKTVTTDRGVKYSRFSPTVTFKCTGSTTKIQCNYMPWAGAGAMEGAVAEAGTQQIPPLEGQAAAAAPLAAAPFAAAPLAAAPLAAAPLAGYPQWGQPVSASRVCVWNKGGYALNYKVKDAHSLVVVAQTSNYPNPQTQCTNLRTTSGVYTGQELAIWVSAVAGKTVTTNPGVKFHPLAMTVTFKCTGSTTTIQCNFESVS